MELILDADLDDLKVWLQEAEEQLQVLDQSIVRLEKEGDDDALLQSIFRAAHTLKGSSATIKHTRMANLTHAMEGVLDELRNRRISVTSELIDALLDSLDNLGRLRDEVVSSTINESVPVERLVSSLSALKQAAASGGAAVAVAASTPVAVAAAAPAAFSFRMQLGDGELQRARNAEVQGLRVLRLAVDLAADSALPAARLFQILTESAHLGEIIASQPTMDQVLGESDQLWIEVLLATLEEESAVREAVGAVLDIASLHLEEISATAGEKAGADQPAAADGATSDAVQVAAAEAGPAEAAAAAAKPAKPGQRAVREAATVRVDVERLDNLMNLVGELVIDRTRLEQIGRDLSDRFSGDNSVATLIDATTHIGRITDELQEEVMRSRMLPIENVFNRFPRMIRDLARKAGKQIDFVIEGKETELDRSVIEEIGDPLIHLLRNSVDHGIEPPEQRKAAGKPEQGTIKLSARHEENHIVITVQDDGRGINGQKVREKAVEKGLISAEGAARLTEAESVDLIFLPGLSTSSQVSEVSGRGVGMDIVKNNIERLNGTVGIGTEVGVGSSFEIKMPLTLAIIRALLVSLGSRVFAVPLISVRETLELKSEDVSTVQGREVMRLRGEVVPLMRLGKAFKQQNAAAADQSKSSKNGSRANGEQAREDFVVAVRLGERQVGIAVDSLLGEQEIVIKSLGRFIGEVQGVAGATILGDGRVALILDVGSLLHSTLLGK